MLNNISVFVMGYIVYFIVIVFFGFKMEGLYRDCIYKVFCFVIMVFEIIKVFKYMLVLNWLMELR